MEALKATFDGERLDWNEYEAIRFLDAQAESNKASALVQAAAKPTGPSVVRQQAAEEEPSVACQQTVAEVPSGSSEPPWVTSRRCVY